MHPIQSPTERSDRYQMEGDTPLVRDQATNLTQSPFEAPISTLFVPDTPVEKNGKVAKVKKKKKDKTSSASHGNNKLKKAKITGNRPEGSDQQHEKGLEDAPVLDAKRVATAIASSVQPEPPPEVAGNQDMSDWLEFTGYFDIENRRRLLKLFRRRKVIQEELAGIDSEINESTVGVVFADEPPTPPLVQQGDGPPPPASSALKRIRSPGPSAGADAGRAEKLRRVEPADLASIGLERPHIPGHNKREPPRPRSPLRRPSSSYETGYYDRHASLDAGRPTTYGQDRSSRSPVRSEWPPYHKSHAERRGSKNTYTRTWINPTATTSRKLSGSAPLPQPRSM